MGNLQYGHTYSNMYTTLIYEHREINPQAIRFTKNNNDMDQGIFIITIDKFDYDEIENIKTGITKINNTHLNGKISDIIDVVKHSINNENSAILAQTDSYIFMRHNGLPILEIKNNNSMKYRDEHKIRKDKTFSLICYLDKIYQ